jgi:hypothetical protein
MRITSTCRVGIALVSIAASGAVARGGEAKRLHVLLVCDTNAANIDKGVAVNAGAIEEILGEIFRDRPQRLGSLPRVLRGDEATPQSVLEAIARIPVDPGRDAILFYYAGHGAWDPNRLPSGEEVGHFFAMSGGPLRRSVVREALLNRSPYAVFLLSDCCSSFAPIPRTERRVPAEWAGFQDLFFRHRGLVDIQGAARGEFGWYNDTIGGLFTRSLVVLLCQPRSSIRLDGMEMRIRWEDDFFPRLKRGTLDLFQKTKAGATRRPDGSDDILDAIAQTPSKFYLDRWVAHKIVSVVSGKCLDVTQGGLDRGVRIQQWADNDTPAQHWIFGRVDDDTIVIVPTHSGLRLDVKDGITAEGTPVQQWPSNGTPAQQWRLVRQDDDTFTIVSVLGGLVLEVRGGSRDDGAVIQVGRDIGSPAQRWRIVAVDD